MNEAETIAELIDAKLELQYITNNADVTEKLRSVIFANNISFSLAKASRFREKIYL